MVFTGVTDSRSLCRDKLHFSQNVFAASTSTVLCGATRCATARSGPTKPVGQQDESSIGFQRRNDLQDNLHIQTCRATGAAIAMWAGKRAPRVKSSALYCSLVVRTPDVHRYIYSALYRAPSVGGRLEDCKERQQSRMFLREPILHHADDKPKIRERS